MYINKIIVDWERLHEKSYIRQIKALQGLEELKFNHPITFFCGENGTGKSTLLEAIAVAYGFNPEGGTLNYSFSTYDTHSELCKAINIVKGFDRKKYGYFLRAESFYNVATKEMEYADLEHPSLQLHKRSHGESFLTIVQNNISSRGLYLLDEPEAALSPQRQLTLLIELNRLAKTGAQFIIVTHSPILLGIPSAEIFLFDNEKLHSIDYEETDSYMVTELFINHREQVLKRLLEEQ